MPLTLPGFRYIVLITAALCLTSLLSNMTTYNFTKICMAPSNHSTHSGKIMRQYNKSQQSWLQACVAIGALMASLPYTYMFQHYTKKWVFLSAGVISAVSTVLVPLANESGFKFFLLARTLQGVAFSATFPIMGAVTADWAMLSEHGLFVGLLTGCTQLSNMFTMPVSGALCSSRWGWPSVYYVHAAVSVVAFTFWLFVYKDQPDQHSLVGAEELKKLTQGKGTKKKVSTHIPYRSILTSKVLWGAWIAAFGDLLAVQLVSMFNPQYLNDYLHFNVLKTGFLGALPVAVQFALKLIGGVSSDMLTCFDETAKVRVYNSIALGASAIFFAILAFVPRERHVFAIVILVFAESLLGLNTAGFNKCATLHSRQYGHFVMTQIMNIWAVTILLEPFVVHAIVADNNFESWRNCFLFHAFALLACNAVFCMWADAKPAPWTNVVETEKIGPNVTLAVENGDEHTPLNR